jgi:hypothetical protein
MSQVTSRVIINRETRERATMRGILRGQTMRGVKEKQESEKFHRDSWHSLSIDPKTWLRSGERLKTAADALRKSSLWPAKRKPYDRKSAVADFHYGPVYMLLAGLAIETLIKGIVVARHPDFVKQQKLSRELTNHNLTDLYGTAGLMKNRGHYNLLLRLQNYVVIFGRYPVAKTKQDMQKLSDTRFAGQTDPERIDRLWNFLVKKIQPYIQQGD